MNEETNIANNLENVMAAFIDNSDDLDFGLETFNEILNLDDENFEVLSERFIIEIEKLFVQYKPMMTLWAEKNQNDYIELQASFDAIKEEIDKSDYSEPKKDFLLRFIGIILNNFMEGAGAFNRIVQIPIELEKGIKVPTYATDGSAGMDIYSPIEVTLAPGESKIIPTGIKTALPKGYALLIQPRSGMSVKTKLRVANTPGLIDSDYRDTIGVIVENIEPPIKDITYDFDNEGKPIITSILHGESFTIHEGERFAQMRLVEAPTAAFYPVDSVKEIGDDRKGGFGHTGN